VITILCILAFLTGVNVGVVIAVIRMRLNPTEATERIEELEKAFEKLEIAAEAGASREAALRSTIAELQRENAVLTRSVTHSTESIRNLERENAALRAALDAARKEQP